MDPRLAHIESWIFDLDNTLYPASASLFALIDERMRGFISERLGLDEAAAHRLQKDYFRDHGTTLAGLMAQHGTDPHEFLEYVHDIALDRLSHDQALADLIAALPGRKYVFTNGDRPYAIRVLDKLGLGLHFDDIHDVHDMGLVPKPSPRAYDGLCARLSIRPDRALFAEDMARNLAPAKALGMTTLWVENGSEQAGGTACASYVDYVTRDLTAWLQAMTGAHP